MEKSESVNWSGRVMVESPESPLTFLVSAPMKWLYSWGRFDLRDALGKLVCFTNPISSGQKKPAVRTWGELLDKEGIKLD
ncbi:hypothetical protein ACFFNY_11315 [Paenibacillus hodogayensis]|uniref:Uncharacterized protein n=1 Tax=Paenibacillus hodogayensis TaxID=279208 RepID=A0ABV5VV21_9BACL